MHFITRHKAFLILLAAVVSACSAEGDNPGVEFAPNMYHSVPYDPLTQITDKEIGGWLSSNEADVHAEFYNSNPYNLHGMTMREPAPNTVRRTNGGVVPITIPADTLGSTYWLDYASVNLKSPYEAATGDEADAVLQEGTLLYARFCTPCHGGGGQGDGRVGQVFKGVPSFSTGRYASMTEGHVFHVITHGRGRMAPYNSQLDIDERWKIARYVQQLQNQ